MPKPFPVRSDDTPQKREELTARARHELMRIRASARPANPLEDSRPFLVNREAYEKAFKYPSSTGWRPDPKRRVSTHWKKMLFQFGTLGLTDMTVITDASDGKPENVFLGEEGPFRVRWLKGQKEGQVENVAPELYITFRGPPNPSAEPVPDDEPLCPPARPENMPSSFAKAQSVVGKILKRDPESITFEEAVTHFKKLLAGLSAR